MDAISGDELAQPSAVGARRGPSAAGDLRELDVYEQERCGQGLWAVMGRNGPENILSGLRVSEREGKG